MLADPIDQAVDFKRLAPLTITSPDMELPMDPGIKHGTLPCGLTYYVKAKTA